MLTDIEKLVKYQETLSELHGLKKRLPDETHYDEVEVRISPNTLITERWTNKDGKVAKTYEFPFSAILDISERLRKKNDYRKKILEKNKNKEDKPQKQ